MFVKYHLDVPTINLIVWHALIGAFNWAAIITVLFVAPARRPWHSISL